MSEDGRDLGPTERVRTHGGPWARMYRRHMWAHVRFPEGFWFEDTLIAYCKESMKCLFALCCECIGRYYPNMENATIGGGLGLLEESLLSGNYDMWREACRWVR